jgi:MFS family permease
VRPRTASPDKLARASEGARPRSADARLSRLPALTHRPYRVYLAGMPLSEGAVTMFQVAAAWSVYELARPPLNVAFMLGVLGFCRTIPMLSFVLVGGVAADRLGRRRMLLVTNGCQAAVAALFAAGSAAGWINVWLVLAAVLLMGGAMAFNRPSHQAFIRDLVGGADVQNAVALAAMSRNVVGIVAPVVAGAVLAAGGGAALLGIVATGHAVMCGLLLTIRVQGTSAPDPAARAGVLASLGEVFRYVRSERLLRTLLLVETIPGLFALPYATMLPVFAGGIYERGAGGLGLMQSMVAIGALTGSLTLTLHSRARRRGLLLIGAITSFGVMLVLFALVHAWPLALVLLVVIGLSDTLYFLTINTLMLTQAPEHLRGRVMSLFTLADLGMLPLGSVMLGGLAGVFGVRAALAGGGLATVAVILGVAARVPHLRRA